MRRDAIRDWLRSTRTTSSARHVFHVLIVHANQREQAWPSVETLADETALGERTVQRALRELEAVGLVRAERRPGAVTIYFVHVDPRHSDTPATVTPPPQRHPGVPETTSTPATVTPEGFEGLHEGARGALVATFSPGSGMLEEFTTNGDHVDVKRNTGGVKAARRAVRSARKRGSGGG